MKTEAPWRVILDGPASASWHMAADEAIAYFVRNGTMPPTIRLYHWARPALTLGRFQAIHSEVELDVCSTLEIDVVRRITGGRAILHDPAELTYAFAAPFIPPFADGLHASYRAISEAFIAGLSGLGIPASLHEGRTLPKSSRKNPVCFQSTSFAEVSVAGRKVIGSAQKRWTDGLLQQGSIPLDIPYERLFAVLRFPTTEDRRRAREAALQAMAGLREFLPALDRVGMEHAVIEGFESRFGVRLVQGAMSSGEAELADSLVKSRYDLNDWNELR